MKKTILLFGIALAMFIFAGCKDDGGVIVINIPQGGDTPQGEDFCQFVSEENFELTIEPINNFLKELGPALSDAAKLEKLCSWLEERDCVLSAEILHIGGIYTLPGISELVVVFEINNVTRHFVLDVVMSEPLTAHWCHELE